MLLIIKWLIPPVKGKKAIGAMFATELSTADMTCIPINIFEDGDWAILE
ncbi:hypothetical protein ACFSTE_04185 [Aquimarina hainanensis]|uniref:Uncharacterized protein n=1 Tax=Aquimarina hainanensis TaxID=1578017 RepID=A0ABW5N322_9FLAO